MLSNSDFANLIKSGAEFTRDDNNNNNKQRFDIKQVRQWDKQNKQLEKRRSHQKINVLGGEEEEEEEDSGGGGARGQGSSHGKSSKKLFLPPGYRDRAEERRKGVSADNSSQLDELATTMDAEQTKFLGGDVEHTHLVKGLDYALLHKMREQLKKQKREEEEEEEGSDNDSYDDSNDDHDESDSDDDYGNVERGRDKKKAGISLTNAEEEENDKQIDETIEILTPLGRRLHHLLIANKVHKPSSDAIPTAIVGISSLLSSSVVDDKTTAKEGFVVLQSGQQPMGKLKQSNKLSKDSLTQMYHKIGRAGQVLARIQYEFYLSVDGPDVPVTLSRAAKEVESNQDYVSYAMPKSLMTQLSACYEGGKLRRRSRKPQQQLQPQTGVGGSSAIASTSTVVAGQSGSNSLETTKVIKPSDSLYDGILEDAAFDGKYDPSASSSYAVGSAPSGLTGSVKGIFSNASFRPHTLSAQSDNSCKISHAEPTGRSSLLSLTKEEAVKGDASILQPIKNLLAAQARNKREQAHPATASSKGQGNVVYRDVFASSKEKVVEVKAEEVLFGGKQHGDAFGLSGTYDIFPENAGYDDFMDDSDGEGGKAGGARKRPKLSSGGKNKAK
eukprot:scaffold381_cov168-Ochromonas_danica.AAC.9